MHQQSQPVGLGDDAVLMLAPPLLLSSSMLPGNRAPEPTACDQAGSSSSGAPGSNGG